MREDGGLAAPACPLTRSCPNTVRRLTADSPRPSTVDALSTHASSVHRGGVGTQRSDDLSGYLLMCGGREPSHAIAGTPGGFSPNESSDVLIDEGGNATHQRSKTFSSTRSGIRDIIFTVLVIVGFTMNSIYVATKRPWRTNDLSTLSQSATLQNQPQ